MRRILGAVFNRTMLVLLGLLALALLVWFVGPLIAVGSFVPLESVLARAIVIGLILAVWLGLRAWRWWRARRANAALLSQITKDDGKAPAVGEAGKEQVAELRRRFESAIATLKKARIESGQAGWFGRFSRRYVYQMPWYMFIGAPGSGKTTALVNSGIEFPLAKEFGKTAIRGVGGTRNCDWWFTNDAVLLDTAGRYTTQESDESVDKAEWQGFISLLRKFRPRAPINGVLVTVSVADLLGGDEAEGERHAVAVRHRLAELDETLKARLPVYVLVTKVDLLAGFNEYFARLSNEDRAQVWGFTLPLATSEAREPDIGSAFRNEFGLLQKRVELALPDVLQAEGDVAKRAQIYAFPQELAGLRELLDRFLQVVFAPSKFAAPPLVRGVYLTSGTQEGTPFDRVLGAMQRQLGLAAAPQSAPAAAGTGRSYFLRNLLQKVVFGESFLVARNPARDRRRRLVQGAGIGASVLLLGGALAAWFVSYSNNRAYLANLGPRVESLANAVRTMPVTAGDDIHTLVPILDQARALSSTEQFPVDDPPLSYRFGLYQGYTVHAAAEGTYERLLDDLLLPRVSRRFARLLREAPPDNLEALYGRLKAYLMLYDPEHYRPAYLLEAAQADFLSSEGAALPRAEQQAALQHLQRLFEGRVRQAPFPIDAALVADARLKLGRYTQAQRLYAQLRLLAAERAQGQAPSFTLLSAVGPDATLVFARASGASLDQGVPALFTRDGYRAMANVLQDRRLLVQLDETWVLGKPDRAAGARLADLIDDRLVLDIRRLYLEDYRRTWDRFLADLRLVPAPNLAASIQQMQVLSGPDSPLMKLIRAVAAETTLVETGRAGVAVTDRAVEAVKEAGGNAAQRVFGSSVNVRPAATPEANRPGQLEQQLVDDYFVAWRRLAGSPQQGGGGEALKNLLAEQYNVLVATESALRSRNTPPQSDVSAKLLAESARLPVPLRGMLEGVAAASSGHTTSVTRSNILAQINAAVGDFCRQAIGGRYPFQRDSPRDVTADDFARLFRPGGLMDDFFQKNLREVVDTTTRPWTFRRGIDGGAVGTSGSILAFQRAAVIRDAFFPAGGVSPQFRVDIKPLEMDPSITGYTLDVDGTVVTHTQGPASPRSVVWPGPAGRSQVRLQLSPTVSASSTATFEGPWALHRLFDRAQVASTGSPERFAATLNLDGRRVVLDVTAGSIRNPFRLRELEEFKCPG